MRYEIQSICARNILELTGNNVMAVHWNVRLTNREGRPGKNAGVSVVTVAGAKVSRVEDYLFETGAKFRRLWGAASDARPSL
jgi:ketosteroid isomerase-like protein